MRRGAASLFSADLSLARRIEHFEAANCTAYAEGMAEALAEGMSCAERVAGGSAIFGGLGSPMTHAVGIGMSGPITPDEFDRLEAFYRSRGSSIVIDLCSMADPSVLIEAGLRHYRIATFEAVLACRLEEDLVESTQAGVEVEPASPDRVEAWAHLVTRGFSGQDEIDENTASVLGSAFKGSEAYFARMGGEDAGGAGLRRNGDIVFLFGDATLVKFRGKGVQQALIARRLARAKELGCGIATATVDPASGSHRNYERAGFRTLYTRAILVRD